MNTLQNSGRGRKVYLDALRILAIIGVLFNHTGTHGFVHFTVARDSTLFPLYLFYAVICKAAVPIFLMISGALLLKKEEPLRVLLIKRFLKYLLILFVASLIMRLFYLGWDLKAFSFEQFLKDIYSTNIATAHWYLYAYLGYILSLPLLRKLAAGMKGTDYLYLTGLMLLPSVLKSAELLIFNNELHYHSSFDLFSAMDVVYYPLMGDFLGNKLKGKQLTRKVVFTVGTAGLVLAAVNCWLTCVLCNMIGEWKEATCQMYMNGFMCVISISIFLLVRFFFLRVRLHPWINRCIVHLGSCTFGIFIFEKIYREAGLYAFEKLNGIIPEFTACWIWVLCAFAVGAAVTSVAKVIPGLKNWL